MFHSDIRSNIYIVSTLETARTLYYGTENIPRSIATVNGNKNIELHHIQPQRTAASCRRAAAAQTRSWYSSSKYCEICKQCLRALSPFLARKRFQQESVSLHPAPMSQTSRNRQHSSTCPVENAIALLYTCMHVPAPLLYWPRFH